MPLPGSHSRRQLIKLFSSLGPYLREHQSHEDCFFFDCLAVCVNASVVPDKREFWGWWLELTLTDTAFLLKTQSGLYDKSGNWGVREIKHAETQKRVDETLQQFCTQLTQLCQQELKLSPATPEPAPAATLQASL